MAPFSLLSKIAAERFPRVVCMENKPSPLVNTNRNDAPNLQRYERSVFDWLLWMK